MVPVIRDAGRKSFEEFLDAYDALVEKARTNTLTADDLTGANLSLTNPGGIGTIASVPRLMVGQGTIVATGAIGYPPGLGAIGAAIGAEKVMTMTSTYDHRIIQGAESGRFLQRIDALLQGEEGFYERVFGDLGLILPSLAPPRPVPAVAPELAAAGRAGRAGGRRAGAPAATFDEELLQAVQAATSLLKAHRTHGHLAARLDPLGREPEGDPALDPEPLGLSPELMERIPAHILRMYVPGRTLAEALPHLRETYCGPIAYEIEHIASHRQRLWLREAIESGRFRSPLGHRGADHAAAAPDRGRRARALHAQGLPGPEAVLDRGPRHDRPDARRADPDGRHPGRARGRDRHGPPRPAERAGPQPGPGLRLDLRRVRGLLDARADHHDPPGRHGRRQVPPRRPGLLPAAQRRVDHRPPGVQSLAPGVRGSGGRRRHARGADHPAGPARPPRDQRRGAGDPPRRRGLPGPGRGGRDAQSPGARWLHRRRHDPHHPEQPGRLHHRPRRLALDDLGLRPGQGLRRADHPRQRRRRPGLRRRGQAGLRLPPGVRARRADRPDRLPPLRPQRGRRARLHPARDVPGDQEAPAGARAVRPLADRAGRGLRAGVDRADRPGVGGAGQRAPGAQGPASPRPRTSATPPASTSSTAPRRPRSTPRWRPIACACSTTSCWPCPTASRSIPSWSASSSSAARCSPARARPAAMAGASCGPTPRRWPTPRCSPRGSRSA